MICVRHENLTDNVPCTLVEIVITTLIINNVYINLKYSFPQEVLSN